jgi:hypothetical protein
MLTIIKHTGGSSPQAAPRLDPLLDQTESLCDVLTAAVRLSEHLDLTNIFSFDVMTRIVSQIDTYLQDYTVA